jgi:NhaC family Na+:H+ antiporter
MTADTSAAPGKLSLAEALIPVVLLVVLIGLSFYLFRADSALGPNQLALIVAELAAVFIGWRRGHTLAALGAAGVASVSSGISAIFILFAVGALIGAWAMSGTLIAMVYYGLQLLSPDYFYMSAALICAVIALSIGSSWTVVATVGIGLMGIARTVGLDPAITAGAIVSGAYVGDKCSPLSDSVNLAAAAAGADLYTHLREVPWTTIPALLVTLGLFLMLGERGDFDASDKIRGIQAAFDISPVLFLPMVLVAVLAVLKLPPFIAIFLGALAGCLLAVIVAPGRVVAFADSDGLHTGLALFKGVWRALASGYRSTTGDPGLDALLSRGGMGSMLNTIWLIVTALSFGGVVEKVGVIDRLISPVIRLTRSTGSLVTALVGSVVATNIVAADQYIAIVLPARMFRTAFADRGLAPVVLSRAVGDTGTVTSALVPWNSCGAFMAATLGVSTFSFAPWAFFNFLSPLFTVAIAFAGLRMLRAPAAARVTVPAAAG